MTMRGTTAHNNGGCRQLITQWPIWEGISDAVPSGSGNMKPSRAAGVMLNTKDRRRHETKNQAFTHHQQREHATVSKRRTKTRKRAIGLRHYTTILFLVLYALTMEVEMNDASTASKRPAPLSSLGAAKKRVDEHRSPEGRHARFMEPEPDETLISTKLNKHVANPLFGNTPGIEIDISKNSI
jgi:hypothetical protein